MPVEVANWEEFQADVAALQDAIAAIAETGGNELRTMFEQGLMVLQGAAADYPQQPDTEYRRTGTLGRTWVSAGRVIEGRHVGDLVGRVGNATPYGLYVQDPARQAEFHADIWHTTDDIVADNRDAIDDLLSQAGGRIVKRLAGGLGL